MKMTTITKAACVVAVAAMFASCSTSNQLASSFGKRKYTKGYFFNNPGKQKGVDSYETSYAVNKTTASEATAPVVAQNAPVALTNSVAPAVAQNAPASSKAISHKSNFVARLNNALAAMQSEKKATAIASEQLPSNNGTSVQAQVTDNTDAITSEMKGGGGSCKDWLITVLLCFFLGGLGIHRFYLGYTWQGVVQLLTGGGCGIWALIDFIRILMKTLKPKSGSYCN